MARGAADVRVGRVLEADRPLTWRLARGGDAHRNRHDVGKRSLLVTLRAVTSGRILMMTDLAPARWLECQLLA
jgi:hypothetical protein